MQRPDTTPPLELNPLFGRESDLRHVAAQLDAGRRLITLTGTPGSGKTRLAREVLRGVRGRSDWPGGAHLCSLRALLTPDDIVRRVAAAFDVPLGDEPSSPRAAAILVGHLAHAGRGLVVLDDADHLLAPVRGLVSAWLDGAPDLIVLVTSREGLGHPDEALHGVGPLALPTVPSEALEAPAVQLFLSCCANLAVRVPTATEAELGDLVALVTRLDGNPLAIALAAARTPLLSPNAILARLGRRFEVLSQATPQAVGLWDAINASWQSLTPPEQRALMQLALFRGGASVEPFEALIEADGAYQGQRGLDLLGSLLRKSLATSAPSPALPAERRIDLYESIREFALGRLAESPALTADLTERFITWCAATLSRAGLSQHGPEARTMFLALASELANVLAALARATVPEAPAHWACAAAEALVAGHRLLLGLVPIERMERIVAGAASHETSLGLETRIRLSAIHANYLALLDEVEAARRTLDASVALAVAAGDSELEGLALRGFSGVVTYLEADLIVERLERALELLVAPRWRSDSGHARAALALIYARQQAFERGDAAFAEAVAELGASTDALALGRALGNWGATFALRGRWDDARDVLQRALEISRHASHRLLEAATLCSLGECELKSGRLASARSLFSEGSAIARAAGYRRHGSVAAGYLAAIAHLSGDPAAAVTRYDEALSLLGSEWDAALARGLILSARALALAHLAEGDAAAAGFLEAHRLLAASGDESLLAAHAIHRLAADVALGRRAPAAASDEARGIAARAEAQRPRLRLSHVQHAIALLEQVLATRPEPAPVGRVSIGPDTSSITLDEGTPLDLRRSPKTRRLVALLVARRRAAPGVAVTVHDLFDAAWPGDRTPEPHRSNRVYVALTRLRSAGFGALILHDGDGYLLDPHIAISDAAR